jgi:hypothetical protein
MEPSALRSPHDAPAHRVAAAGSGAPVYTSTSLLRPKGGEMFAATTRVTATVTR